MPVEFKIGDHVSWNSDAGRVSGTIPLCGRASHGYRRARSLHGLLPAELARPLSPARTRDVPVVFYLGCNAIRTPHLPFNAMYVPGAIGIDYEVTGGPGACCGIIYTK